MILIVYSCNSDLWTALSRLIFKLTIAIMYCNSHSKVTMYYVADSEHRACLQALQIWKSPSVTQQELQQASSYVSGCTLPHKNIGIRGKYTVCTNSVSLIKRTQPSLLNHYSPVTVHGDGKCLLRAVGVALFDNKSHHLLLRALAALEIREHREQFCKVMNYK